MDRLLDYISQKKESLGLGDNWAVVFVDKALQHILSEATAQKALDQRVLLRVLPEGQTHVWQPCDMHAIATINSKVDRMWDEEKELLWQTLPSDEAVKQVCIQSAPSMKQRMFRFMASAIDSLTPEVICLCWDASSLSTALFAQPPRCVTAFWSLGCSVPSLANIQAQEDVRTQAHDRMLQALAAANAAHEM